MKLLLIFIATALLGLTSCESTPKQQKTHTHEDGTVHAEHSDCEESKSATKQESFTVEADSTAVDEKHDHDHGHNHDHDHSGHKH